MAPRPPQLESYQYGSISVKNSPNSNKDDHVEGGRGDEESLPLLIGEPAVNGGGFISTTTCMIPSFKTVAVCITSLAFVAAGVFMSLFHGRTATRDSEILHWGFDGGKMGGDFSPLASPIEMGLRFQQRENDASPSNVWSESFLTNGPLPTNSWFLNLVSHRAWLQPDESTRVYTVPYIVDTAPAAAADSDTRSFAQQMQAGLRVHWPIVQANDRNMQMVNDWKNGLCLGTTDAQFNVDGSASSPSASRYHVVDPGAFSSDDDDGNNSNNRNAGHSLSRLGLVLEWSGDNSSSNNNNTDGATSSSSTSISKRRMVSPIVRGMPMVTMEYHGGVLPTLYSYNGPSPDGPAVVIDDDQELQCGTRAMINNATATSHATTSSDASAGGETALVQKEVRLHFINSDFTWIVFFSQPIRIRCDVSAGDKKLRDFSLSVVSVVANEVEGDREDANLDMTADEKREQEPLAVRVALLDQCTTGHGNIKEHCTQALVHGNTAAQDKTTYAQMLRDGAHVVPVNPDIQFQYPSSTKSDNGDESTTSSTTTQMTINWGAKVTSSNGKEHGEDLLMFAMPHHQDLLASTDVNVTDVCFQTFHGRTCLVRASTWKLSHETNKSNAVSFAAPRPPAVDFIPTLAKALDKDINYKLPDNLKRAAADTYFSGKILARLARVIVMTAEMQSLAQSADDDKVKKDLTSLYHDADETTLSSAALAAAKADWPSDKHLQTAIAELKTGVQAWMETNAEAPYIYDTSWGGLVNCGCHYIGWDVGNGDKGHCNNTFPNCPALASVNEDFGNGYYNDHHYHYGYHVYAAAVVAKFDPKWAIEYFDRVMLYIRDFANPYENDPYFVQFRQKDWFLGSSWASGIVSAENSPHGRNEESSSEAIAAYEGVALFGTVMVDVFTAALKVGSNSAMKTKLETARLVRESGQLLTTTEVAATQRYWHVWSSDDHVNTYPAEYEQPVVGMLYDTMASFQTWFAPYAVVSYGIQLMPLTPIAEQRDDPTWAAILYPKYNQSCVEAGDFCIDNGWTILQAGLCATAGDKQEALKQALAVPSKVFNSQGGMGNSLSNTIWYIATRKSVNGGD